MVYDINLFMEQAGVAEDVGSESERLKFVTQHFSALQGLNFAAVGTMFFLSSVWEIWQVPWWADILAFGLLIVLVRRLPSYYEHRFGRVEPKHPTNLQAIVFVAIIIVCLIWGRHLELVLSKLENWVHQTIPAATGISPLVLWMFGFLNSLGRRSRFDPQGPYFFFFGMVLTSIVAFVPLWYPVTKQLILSKVLDAGWIGLTLIAWGLHDHFLLIRLLPNQGSDDDES